MKGKTAPQTRTKEREGKDRDRRQEWFEECSEGRLLGCCGFRGAKWRCWEIWTDEGEKGSYKGKCLEVMWGKEMFGT